MNPVHSSIISFIREQFATDGAIPLHAPTFRGNEKKYLIECIDSTFVSSVGPFVDVFETEMAKTAGASFAVAAVNGTQALQLALLVAGVAPGDEVITQALTFVASANAVSYCQARPVFVDVEERTLGMDPSALRAFLEEHAELRDGGCFNKATGKRLSACVPVHVFGHPCRIDEIVAVCDQYGISVVEDAAEAIGSTYRNRPCGSFGRLGVFSFNGNKTITSGGGGAIVTSDPVLARRAKHLTTTAKAAHKWEFFHDELGYNCRLPNINAALACAQLESLSEFIQNKRELASIYRGFFADIGVPFQVEPAGAVSNYWLNAIFLEDRAARDEFLKASNDGGVMTRPCWTLLNKLPMYRDSFAGPLPVSHWIEDRLVNIPSSVR